MANNSLDIKKLWNGDPSDSHYKISFSLSPQSGDLNISIDAPFFDDPAPVNIEPGKFIGLHDFEVVEVLLCSDYEDGDEFTPYLELQVGPHGHYMLIYFLTEAGWDTQDTSVELEQLPIIKINKVSSRWTANIAIPSFILPEPLCGEDLSITWMANAFAIHGSLCEESTNSRQYLAHSPVPGSKPNFHQLCSFVPLTLVESVEGHARSESRKYSVAKDLIAKINPGGGDKVSSSSSSSSNEKGYGQGTTNSPHVSALLLNDLILAEQAQQKPLHKSATDLGKTESANLSSRKATEADNAVSSQSPMNLVMERILKEAREQAAIAGTELGELPTQFNRSLQGGEFAVLYGMVIKRKGISWKSRMCILTSTARLLYFNSKGTFKGQIPWSITKPLKVVKVNERKFDITVHDNKRTYHFIDNKLGADLWVSALSTLMASQRTYLRSSLQTVPLSSSTSKSAGSST